MNQHLLDDLLLDLPTMIVCLILQALLEAVNGDLMIGTSTAMLMFPFQGWMQESRR